MPERLLHLTSKRDIRLLQGFVFFLTLLLPWLLVQTQAGSEAAIDGIAIGFLGRSVVMRDWAWRRHFWVRLGLIWWGWLVLCTLVHVADAGWMSVVQALGVVRFLIFTAALAFWILAGAEEQKWFFRSLSLVTLYVVAQTLTQFVTGHNWFGAPVSADGELTGPFDKPRDGPSLVRMILPVLAPPAYWLLAGEGWAKRLGARRLGAKRLGAMVLLAAALAVMVLIGQRMPLLLMMFGLVLMGLLLPRLRGAVVVALVAGGGLLAASVVVAPHAFYRLVTKFSRQMADFADSPYGLIAGRSVAIAEQHPLTGRGYDGFRSGCTLPRYFQGWHWPGTIATGDGGGAALCVTHPHNFYLQAVTDAGVPGLLLFCALVGAWLYQLGSGLRRQPDPLRVGLFVAALIQVWPIASTSPVISMPIGGWFFLLLGFGLAVKSPPA